MMQPRCDGCDVEGMWKDRRGVDVEVVFWWGCGGRVVMKVTEMCNEMLDVEYVYTSLVPYTTTAITTITTTNTTLLQVSLSLSSFRASATQELLHTWPDSVFSTFL